MTRGLDLLNEIADRLGWRQITSIEGQTLSNEERKLLRLLNRVLQTLEGVDDWPMLRKDGAITLVAKDISTTVSGSEQWVTATLASATVTVANGDFDDTYINRQFQVQGYPTIYRIVDVPSATELVLDKAWVDASIVAATNEIGFNIGVDQYTLPTDFDRPATSLQSFLGPYKIQAVSPNEFSEIRRQRTGIIFGDPSFFTIYGMNDGQTAWKIHFHQWPSEARVIRFEYQMIHPVIDTDQDKILFPPRYNEAIIETVLQLAQRDYEDSAKTQQTLLDMLQKFNEQSPSLTDNKNVIRPSKSIRKNHQRAAARAGVRIDYHGYFDKAGNIRLP
jgi:hypothetical protein